MKFFFFKDEIRILYKEFNNTYEHLFEKVPSETNVPFSKVYFSTNSDLNNHAENIKNQFGNKYSESIKLIDTEKVESHETFPIDIGFKKDLEVALEPFKGRTEPLKIAIINAMSNAIGDHLIGMKAFDLWLERVEKYLNVPIEITFFQLNPMRMGAITSQRTQLKNIYVLPNKLSRLIENDAYINLSGLIAKPNFDTQPMIDFFLESLSIPPQSVPDNCKRIDFNYDKKMTNQIEHIDHVIRSKKRSILLFHHKSTSSIRSMSDKRARIFLKELIDNSDYFIISAAQLEFQHERYLDVSRFSNLSLLNFAALIDKADALITVDTSTYHFADAFNTPSVVLFTTINPDLRLRYYPFVESIMLEEENGEIYGMHKTNFDLESSQIKYLESLWDKIDVNDVLNKLDSMIFKTIELGER